MLFDVDVCPYMAQSLAIAAHKGQVDKLGVPYFRHPEAVAKMVEEEWPNDEFKQEAIAVAWLHDVVEDTDITLAGIERYFPKSIVKAVDAITKRPGESRKGYYARVKSNWIAHGVKKLDVRHNQSRVHLIEDAETRDRLFMKYLEAEMMLEGDING